MSIPKTTIRPAIDTDVIGIYNLYRDYLDKKKNGATITYVPEKLLSYVEDIIANDIFFVFVSVINKDVDIVTGVISCIIIDNPFGNDRICREVTWISNPRYPSSGLSLLRKLEEWARDCGATVAMAGCTDDKVERLLSLRGYARSEIIYERNI